MGRPSFFALPRSEILGDLERGDQKIGHLMRGSARTVAAGQCLFDARSPDDYIYRLVEGWACRSRSLEDGRKQLFLIFLPGELVAIEGLFMRLASGSVNALCSAVVERVDRRILHRAFKEDPDVASRCLWQVMEEERRFHNRVVGLGQGDATERLALLLVDLRRRLTHSRAIASDALTFQMPLTQLDLANLLGLTPVHVSRVLKCLRERRMVAIRRSQVTILDWDLLQCCASPLMDEYDRAPPHRPFVPSQLDLAALGRGE